MIIVGVDEAGRGPLAGPVVAAAVMLGSVGIEGLDDSKKLSHGRRAHLEPLIRAHCHVGVGQASVAEIESINILQATLLAMARAVAALGIEPDHILVDGTQLPKWGYRAQAIIGGDAIHPCISAASIIAKQVRDRMMVAAHADHPHYHWHRNKGYGTAAHIAAIRIHGLTPHHRSLFVRGIQPTIPSPLWGGEEP